MANSQVYGFNEDKSKHVLPSNVKIERSGAIRSANETINLTLESAGMYILMIMVGGSRIKNAVFSVMMNSGAPVASKLLGDDLCTISSSGSTLAVTFTYAASKFSLMRINSEWS